MPENGAYGRGLGEHFRLDEAPALLTNSLRNTSFAVTELKSDAPGLGLTTPIPYEEAYLVAVQFRGLSDHELFIGGRSIQKGAVAPGTTSIFDLRRNPVAHVLDPFHSVHWYIPRATLSAIAEEDGMPRLDELTHAPFMDDEVMRQLAHTLLPAFERPEQVNRIFVDHIGTAVCAHVLQTYSGRDPTTVPNFRGHLTARQERRVKEMIATNIDGNLPLEDLARECSLSVSHFARAFRKSTGVPPHRWLLQVRIDKAKEILLDTNMALSEISLICGFADQSHFTRVFTRMEKLSPGAWRREHQ
ncbi:MAG: helix-turn-helix transcriptional regulator [Proteobacteria bacterium]|nr:helix-turn-helix transcriptional regulator [Pseudomonadota bacterium]